MGIKNVGLLTAQHSGLICVVAPVEKIRRSNRAKQVNIVGGDNVATKCEVSILRVAIPGQAGQDCQLSRAYLIKLG